MNPAHQRGQPSTSSVRSFDESNEHATDYISGMYQDFSSESVPPLHIGKSSPKKNGLPTLQTSSLSSESSSYGNSNSTQQRSKYQRSLSAENNTTSPESNSPTRTKPRLKSPSPQSLATQIPLSGLDEDNDSSPSSPAEIAKEMFNLQAFKRMSLDVSNQVSDPDLPSTRMAVPEFSELLEAGVDQDAARLLWVPAHLHPEIAANDEWKDFVQRRVEETKSSGTIGRVKSISGGKRLSRSRSILSKQLDTSDEDTWRSYSDAGHRELERRTSRDGGKPPERHMITVTELEKLETMIKEGALERQGRPLSAEGLEQVEEILPLAADIPSPKQDVPPLMPMKGTLRRSAHTSMRNVRRGGISAIRTARRASEPRKDESRMSQQSDDSRLSLLSDDGMTRSEQFDVPVISPTGPIRSPSMPILEGTLIDSQDEQYHIDDKARTSAPPILAPLDFQILSAPASPPPSELISKEEDYVLGQVQPRQLRRPPLRRESESKPFIAESVSPPPISPPPKDIKRKKSPISPQFPVIEATLAKSEDRLSPTSSTYIQYQQSPTSPEPSTTTTKKNAWSRLFTGVSSSDDDSSGSAKEKSQGKGKPKKTNSYTEPPKVPESKPEPQRPKSSDADRTKKVVEIAPSPVIVATPPVPTPSTQPKSSKKESGLFASIFGSKKKSESKEKSKNQESPSVPAKGSQQDGTQYQRHGPSGWGDQGNAYVGPPAIAFYYTRFPIHVERAIYRLSHIKLANPRRPLLQQVLLSNFMYGYLNLINKAAQPAQPEPPPPPQETYSEPEPQSEEHVFYAGDEQDMYYGQDYYGTDYDEDQDDSVPQGHEPNDLDYTYDQPTSYSSAQGPSQNPSYNKSLPQTNGHTDDEQGGTYILRDSRGRTLSLPKSGETWGQQDNQVHSGKRHH